MGHIAKILGKKPQGSLLNNNEPNSREIKGRLLAKKVAKEMPIEWQDKEHNNGKEVAASFKSRIS